MLAMVLPASASAQSYYPVRLDDPKAIYLTPGSFPVHADGVADDTEALQAAIDKAQETGGEGIVFVPPGRYRLTTTVYVWGGIRIIGYGENRPVLVLAANTPGYTDRGAGEVHGVLRRQSARLRTRRRSGAAAAGGATPQDAGAGTFYSAMSNIDIEIGDGNAGSGRRARPLRAALASSRTWTSGSAPASPASTTPAT